MYKDTIKKNLERIGKLVDEKIVLSEEGVPIFNWLELSPIDLCNRQCVFCPRSDPSLAPNQNLSMPANLYRKLAAELLAMDYSGTVLLAGYGEPLLAKDIVDMVATFSPICNTEITTNGDSLRPKLIDALLKAGVGKIVLSLYDGPEQVEKFEKMFAEAGAPRDCYILRDRWYGSDDNFGIKLTNRAGTVQCGTQPSIDSRKSCYYPHYSMMVDWNGDVFLCPQDWHRRVKAGNVMLSTLMETWTSVQMRRHRTRLANGRRELFPCLHCNAEGTLHGLNHARAWNAFYGNTGDDWEAEA